MKPHYKEYNFNDWIHLSDDIRRDIQNHYWTPFDSAIGDKTRHGILEEFIKTIDNDYYLCEFGYFAHYIVGIRYVPKDSKIRTPKNFHGVLLNKGSVKEMIEPNKIKVNWRYSGTEILEID